MAIYLSMERCLEEVSDLTRSLPRCHFKTMIKRVKLQILKLFFFLLLRITCETGEVKTHRIESRFVTGPEKKKSLQACARTFQPGNLTGLSSEGVKSVIATSGLELSSSFCQAFLSTLLL